MVVELKKKKLGRKVIGAAKGGFCILGKPGGRFLQKAYQGTNTTKSKANHKRKFIGSSFNTKF